MGTYEVTHSFVVSYVEIYMERVQDLLVEVRTSRPICCLVDGMKERIHLTVIVTYERINPPTYPTGPLRRWGGA